MLSLDILSSLVVAARRTVQTIEYDLSDEKRLLGFAMPETERRLAKAKRAAERAIRDLEQARRIH